MCRDSQNAKYLTMIIGASLIKIEKDSIKKRERRKEKGGKKERKKKEKVGKELFENKIREKKEKA